MTTRSASKSYEPEPVDRPTISGRIEKQDETTKDTTKSQVKAEVRMSAKEREFEINLMRQISIGQVCLHKLRLDFHKLGHRQC